VKQRLTNELFRGRRVKFVALEAGYAIGVPSLMTRVTHLSIATDFNRQIFPNFVSGACCNLSRALIGERPPWSQER
jgi:hypothetical protein